MSPGSLTIDALATAADVGVETVRFYERRGLLPHPPRTGSGYRQYPPEAVERFRFIRRAQGLGFTLEEIRDLLELRVDEVAACGPVRAGAEAKIRQVEEKMAELGRIHAAPARLVDACETRKPTTLPTPGLRAPGAGGEEGVRAREALRRSSRFPRWQGLVL